MHPAFRSNKSAVAFCCLLAFLIALPLLLSLTSPPSKEQDFIGMSYQVGPVGWVAHEIYEDPTPADILFVGSSRIMEGVRPDLVEHALSAHLGRPAHVELLALNWPGENLHYDMLRDYFQRHPAKLVIWNLPQPGAYIDEPHVQSYHWVRYGQHDEAAEGLSVRWKMTLYAESVFGSPRALLTKLRPNLVSKEEETFAAYGKYKNEDPQRRLGFNGTAFISDTAPVVSTGQPLSQPVTSPALGVVGPFPEEYQLHYIRKIVDLASQHDAKLVFLHMPTIEEFGDNRMPEIADWAKVIGPDYTMIGAPGDILFAGFTRARLQHFYANNNHFNRNGSTWFTESILPAVLKAYDSANR